MKVWGWVLIILGSLSSIGSIISENTPVGITSVVLGMYLLHRAKENENEQKEKDEWGEE